MSYSSDPLICNEGWVAFEEGKTIQVCPYQGDGEAIADWMAGWADAQRYYEWKNESYEEWAKSANNT